MTLTDDLLAANARYSEGFDAADLQLRPLQHLAILTCMDSRYTSQGVLGLSLGDAHVIRNAGGRVTDWAGNRLTPDSDGSVLAVGNPALLAEAVALLNEVSVATA